jgi:hypothetical protein
MPVWVLLLEYLPLLALLAIGYIFNGYTPQSWVGGLFPVNRAKKFSEAKK